MVNQGVSAGGRCCPVSQPVRHDVPVPRVQHEVLAQPVEQRREPPDHGAEHHPAGPHHAQRLPPRPQPVFPRRQVVERPEQQHHVERPVDRQVTGVAHDGGHAGQRAGRLDVRRHRVDHEHVVPVLRQPPACTPVAPPTSSTRLRSPTNRRTTSCVRSTAQPPPRASTAHRGVLDARQVAVQQRRPVHVDRQHVLPPQLHGQARHEHHGIRPAAAPPPTVTGVRAADPVALGQDLPQPDDGRRRCAVPLGRRPQPAAQRQPQPPPGGRLGLVPRSPTPPSPHCAGARTAPAQRR